MVIFKYFDKPEVFTGLKDTASPCDTCGEVKMCFDAELFYGWEELSSICPDCLASGKLYDKNVFTCQGDIEELKGQLKWMNPSLDNEEIHRVAIQKTFELEKTTPHLIKWQDWNWPCADGDYCKFIGYGSKPLYEELAQGASAKDFFRNSFYSIEEYFDHLWDGVLSDKRISNFEDSNKFVSVFYVFRSLHSDRIITIWDCS
ncbi:CbrC family protein [Emticicia sp. BO119]|uniref:CbrC family protein n=1 Tax=Emticicia sp. BO119 TaxID=2757768 RepID=UPI0015EFFCE5|nr:CbrC family protein [Emticicia sp. BO119]MBA4849545.1 CbrC family protein [Emticicia sp. BO119]